MFVDYRLAEGTDILTTANDTAELEEALLATEGIVAVTAFIGNGATRFNATMQPEQPNTAYAQLIARVADVRTLDAAVAATRETLVRLRPGADVQVTRSEFTPSGNAKIEARFSGPDAAVLRSLAARALDIFLEHDLIDRHADWRAAGVADHPPLR